MSDRSPKIAVMDDAILPDPDLAAAANERAAPVIDWILRERRRAVRTTRFMHDYCVKLVDSGIPVDRATYHIRQLHPELLAITTLWDRQAGGAMELGREYGLENSDFFIKSPVKPIYDGSPAETWRVDDPAADLPYSIFNDLRDQGYSEYTIRPLTFTDGRHAAHSLATRDPDGFSALDMATIDKILPALSTVIELTETRRTAQMLLEIYVGRHAGARVLKGRIRRGDGELIEAVIWLCDLRGFTELSERTELDALIQHLNTYFDTIGAPIRKNGGEILKFIGDAILAIFPMEPGETDMAPACARAVAAARAALAAKDSLNSRRNIIGCPPLDCGIALHVGEVMYGNIGAGDRLDFTVIGPAVNLAARIEGLTRETGQPAVVSEAFAQVTNMTCQPLGSFALKGIAAPQRVFGLPPCAPLAA